MTAPTTTTPGVALIIGAGSGIGLETALTFAERGARAVVFADLNEESAQAGSETSKTIATCPEYSTLALVVDVRDRASVRAVVQQTKEKYGRIDYCVNSAGLSRQKPAETPSVDSDEYDLLHAVNAKGILHCLQEQIPVLRSQEPLTQIVPRRSSSTSATRSSGRGSIVCVTSLMAGRPHAESLTYAASKFAASGIVKTAASENLANDIRINEVRPGFVDTPMVRRGLEEQPGVLALINRSMPMGRMATVEEIAEVIYFLASPAASFVNGEALVADSGQSLKR